MQQSKYFTLYELVNSATAKKQGIANIPTWAQVENLNRLALFLDTIRTRFGRAIMVGSGFRNTLLNQAVGGVSGSQHTKGLAADLQSNHLEELFELIEKGGFDFDQLIMETNGVTRWVHVSIAETGKKARNQVLRINK